MWNPCNTFRLLPTDSHVPLFSRHWLHPSTSQPDAQRLHLSGPALQIQIEIPDDLAALLANESKPIPQPQTGTALIDTGASFTAVDERFLRQLGLVPVGSQPVSTPSGQSVHLLYPCKITFPGTPIPPLPFNAIIGCSLTGFGHVALIGRDLLRHFLLVYNGVEGNWTLAF